MGFNIVYSRSPYDTLTIYSQLAEYYNIFSDVGLDCMSLLVKHMYYLHANAIDII